MSKDLLNQNQPLKTDGQEVDKLTIEMNDHKFVIRRVGDSIVIRKMSDGFPVSVSILVEALNCISIS